MNVTKEDRSPLAMSKTQGCFCLVKKKRDSPKSVSSTRVGFASSTFSTDSSPIQPALLIKQQARWLLPARRACTLLRLVSSVPTVCQSNQSAHLFSPNQVHPPSQRICCIQYSVSLCLCSWSPSPGSQCLSCLTLKLTNIQN